MGGTKPDRVVSCGNMIVTAQHCISGDPYYDRHIPSSTTQGLLYTVRVNFPGDPPEQWTCTCPSFTFRGKCKHITAMAGMSICNWRELVGPEKLITDGICPRCGNMTSEELEDDGKTT